MKEYASEVQNINYMKSLIDGHRIHLVGILFNAVQSGIQLSCLAGGFYALQFRISCKTYFEPLMHASSSCLGFIDVF